ncbi:Conserved_hypothetical protein [Hexamita inflata]|uniref:Uncharacterized protein n=1 Tax=Hexamita inflata TaxID=28002 RepID=A0ABP1GIY5_9EUKA
MTESEYDMKMINEYKNQVKNGSLVIENDITLKSLRFIEQLDVTELFISFCFNICPKILLKIVKLQISGSMLNDEGFKETELPPHLKSLNLSNNDIIIISSLEQKISTKYLYYLNFSMNKIQNIDCLIGFTELRQLNLKSNKIYNIQALKQMKLESLNLEKKLICKIEALSDMSTLVELILKNNKIENISPLENLVNIKVLQLNMNKIICLHALRNIKGLTELNLSHNKLSNLQGLETLVNLIYLDTSENLLENIQNMQLLVNLQHLLMNKTGIEDLSPLRNLKQLTELHLKQNRIKDTSVLGKLKNLQILDLEQNLITDITSFHNLQKLFTLNLSCNRVISIKPLSKLKLLENAYFYDNSIVDIQSMIISNVKSLEIGRNHVQNIILLREFKNYKNFDVNNIKQRPTGQIHLQTANRIEQVLSTLELNIKYHQMRTNVLNIFKWKKEGIERAVLEVQDGNALFSQRICGLFQSLVEYNNQ